MVFKKGMKPKGKEVDEEEKKPAFLKKKKK
jgi:hypothetical protein